MSTLVVTFSPDAATRAVIREGVGDRAQIHYLPDAPEGERAALLRGAAVVLARNTDKELSDEEAQLLGDARLLQFMSAGVDFIALDRLPDGLAIAGNGGGYAEPMAEHALAMILAATKRLFVEHRNLVRGEFNQFSHPNRMLASMTVGILGFGGIGVATARLLRALGVSVHALNRRAATDEPVDWIGGPGELDALLAASDALVLCLPLTARSERLIGARELGLMKPDAILVNLARGEIVDEAALYRHLEAHPEFTACLDAWWVEPVRHGTFRVDQPFLSLPNVIGSPHNSATVAGWGATAMTRAVENCCLALDGKPPRALIGDDERARRRH